MALHWFLAGVWLLSAPAPPESQATAASSEPVLPSVSSVAAPPEPAVVEFDLPRPPVEEADSIEHLPPPPVSIDHTTVLPEVRPPTPVRVAPTVPVRSTATTEASAVAPALASPRRGHVRWIESMGATGIAACVIGVSTVAVGTLFIRKGIAIEPHSTDDRLNEARDYKRPGWILYGTGMGITALGAIALAIDVTIGRERRIRRWKLGPQLGGAHAGLQLRGRF